MTSDSNPSNMGKKHIFTRKVRRILFFVIAAIVILLNVAAWNSASFCDWYIAHVFPIWVNTYGRLTGLFSFSVGEWLILTGLLLVVMAVLLPIVWGAAELVIMLRCRLGSRRQAEEIKEADRRRAPVFMRRFSKGFYRFFVWTLLTVCLVMTLNCFILYHASTFSQRYLG